MEGIQYLDIITHAGIAAGIGRVLSGVSGKRPELSTPNVVHIYSIAITRHAMTQRSRSHSYENHHGERLLVTIAGIPQPSAVLPAAVAGMGLHVDTTAMFFC